MHLDNSAARLLALYQEAFRQMGWEPLRFVLDAELGRVALAGAHRRGFRLRLYPTPADLSSPDRLGQWINDVARELDCAYPSVTQLYIFDPAVLPPWGFTEDQPSGFWLKPDPRHPGEYLVFNPEAITWGEPALFRMDAAGALHHVPRGPIYNVDVLEAELRRHGWLDAPAGPA